MKSSRSNTELHRTESFDFAQDKHRTTRKYKALMLDVDGTIMLSGPDTMPSKRVTNAITKASKRVFVGLATSRPLSYAQHLFAHLTLSGYSIINSGSQIIDTQTKTIVWEQTIDPKDLMVACQATENIVKKKFWINNGIDDVLYNPKKLPKKSYQIYVTQLTKKDAEFYIHSLSHISTLAAHTVPSWHSVDYVDIVVTHASATKQHSIYEVAKLLNIQTHDIIGVGDGYNDFPLLMACGLKVAMGNAVDDLKAIADYVAPSVEQDGVVDVIEKFVLH